MARYEYRCPQHGAFDEHWPMGRAPAEVICGLCTNRARRVLTIPQFTEDRRRLRGERLSSATGRPVAQSRADERRIEREMGIEFVGKADMPRHWREAVDYKAHIDAGGERLPHEQIHAPEPVAESKPLRAYMDEAGYRRGEGAASYDPTPERQTRQLAEIVKASDAV